MAASFATPPSLCLPASAPLYEAVRISLVMPLVLQITVQITRSGCCSMDHMYLAALPPGPMRPPCVLYAPSMCPLAAPCTPRAPPLRPLCALRAPFLQSFRTYGRRLCRTHTTFMSWLSIVTRRASRGSDAEGNNYDGDCSHTAPPPAGAPASVPPNTPADLVHPLRVSLLPHFFPCSHPDLPPFPASDPAPHPPPDLSLGNGGPSQTTSVGFLCRSNASPRPGEEHLKPTVLGKVKGLRHRPHRVPAVGVARDVLVGALHADLQPRAPVLQHRGQMGPEAVVRAGLDRDTHALLVALL